MHYDALTLACMTHELRAHLVGGRVQQVVLPDNHSIGMEVYANRERRSLLLSVAPGAAHVYSPSHKLRRGVEKETPLLLLLRKYVRQAALTDVRQPDITERVLRLHFDHAEHGATALVVELIGRQANALLLGPQDRILECVRRVPASDTQPHARVLLPGGAYTPPAPQDKLPPLDDGSEDYYTRLAQAIAGSGKLWKVLVDQIAGVSPTQARELAWRAAGDANAPAADTPVLAVIQSLQSLWSPVHTGDWIPGLALETESPRAYAPYEIHFQGRFTPTPSLSAAIEAFLAGQADGSGRDALSDTHTPDAYAGLRNQVAAQLGRARRRVERQLAALAADEPAPGDPERLRAQAEWLLALQSQLQPGQSALEVELGADVGVSGVDDDGILRIPLRKDKTPVEQAQQMFRQAGKLSRAAAIIPQRRAQLEADLAFLAQLETDLALAENQPEIATVLQELRATRLLPSSNKPAPRVQPAAEPLRYLAPQGYEIVVGRNARQNERVTFNIAHTEDYWLHARGAPGAHVIIRTGGQTPAAETVEMAAQLAAYYSQARHERAAPVIVTRRKHISRAPGGRKGQVTVRQEETVTVPAELPVALQPVA